MKNISTGLKWSRKRSLVLIFAFVLLSCSAKAQISVDLHAFNKSGNAAVTKTDSVISISWPVGKKDTGMIRLDLRPASPLIAAMQLFSGKKVLDIATNIDPAFILTIGRRDLVSQNGWNIFFDRVPLKPFTTHRVHLVKDKIAVSSFGSRTLIRIGSLNAAHFNGDLQITLFHGSPLLNVAAVMTTSQDSTAIIYDAGLVQAATGWRTVAWTTVTDSTRRKSVFINDTAINLKVKSSDG